VVADENSKHEKPEFAEFVLKRLGEDCSDSLGSSKGYIH